MLPQIPPERSLPMEVTTVTAGPDGASPLACPHCGAGLDVHQPDPRRPRELLATCSGCSDWYFVTLNPSRSEIRIAFLPVVTLVRSQTRRRPGRARLAGKHLQSVPFQGKSA